MKKCIIAGLMLLAVSSAFALETETIAYTNRCGGALDPLFVEQVDRFIKGGKDAGWWTNMISVHFFCAPNQTAAVVNARSTNMTLSVVGGVTHTPYEGFTGNGSSGYLESSSTPGDLTALGFKTNSHSMFVFSQTDNPSVAADIGTMGPVTSIIGLRAANSGAATIWSGSNASWSYTHADPTAKGLSGFVRSSSTGGFYVKNMEQTDFSLNASSVFPAGTVRYFRLGTQTYYSSNQLSFGFVGNGDITPVQTEDLYYRCVEMLVGLGSWTEAGTELQSYIDRAPADTEWNAAFLLSANRFIARAKAAGWWNKMKAIHFLCAPGEEAVRLNVRGTNYNLTTVGSLNFMTNCGVQGAQALTTNATGCLDTGTTLTEFGLSTTSYCMFVYSQTDEPTLGCDLGAMGPSSSTIGVRVKNACQAAIFSGSSTAKYYNVETGVGLTGFVRTNASGGFIAKNNLSTNFTLGYGATPPASTVAYLHAWISAYYSRNLLAFGFIGDGTVTKAHAEDMYESCIEMLDGMGTRWLPELDEPALPPHSFGRNSTNAVTPSGLQIFRFIPPPSSNGLNFIGNPPYSNAADKGYAYGPVSDVVTRPWVAASADTQVGRWELIWSDHANCGWGFKANDPMGAIYSQGVACGTEFSTYSNAIGSTLIKTAYSAGCPFREPTYPAKRGWGDIAEEWGYDVSPWDAYWRGGAGATNSIFTQDMILLDTNNMPIDTGAIVHRKFVATDPAAFFTNTLGNYKTSLNRVILGQKRMADIASTNLPRGFVIDHEHADDRPPDLELKYIIEMRKIAQSKGFKMAAGGEAPGSGIGERCGWTITNAYQILTNLEFFVILVGSTGDPGGNPAKQTAFLQEQFDFFKGPNGNIPVPVNRLCMQLCIGPSAQEIPTNEVIAARNFMISKGISKCAIPQGYATLGGPITRQPNQVIATFLGLSTVTNTP